EEAKKLQKSMPCDVFYRCIFFFQAEDGIRDFHVTGVQTCALPIFLRRFRYSTQTLEVVVPRVEYRNRLKIASVAISGAYTTPFEIGRASCRERGYTGGIAGTVEQYK